MQVFWENVCNESNESLYLTQDAPNRYWPQWSYWRKGWKTGQTTDNEDFIFFDDMLDDVADTYCVDLSRVYVTGQSWGGSMAGSLPCARGNKIAASVSVASNVPLFFYGYYGYYNAYPPIEPEDCERPVPMITMRGATDSYESGEVSDWWYRINGCTSAAGNSEKEKIRSNGRYEDYGCLAATVYIRYSNGDRNDHYIPDDYQEVTMDFFSEHTL